MKALKMLMVFVTTFCLLNVQYQSGVVQISLTNDVQAQANQNLKAEGVYQGDDAAQADGFMDQILYLAIGIVSAGLITKGLNCGTSIPLDVILGAVSGGILIIGELMTMSGNEEAVAALELNYTMDNEGKTYDNAQLEAFRTQQKMNKDLESVLKTKQMIQIAAIAAMLAATISAVVTFATTTVLSVTTAAAAIVMAVCPGACNVQCTAASGAVLAHYGINKVPKPSATEEATKLTFRTTEKTCPATIAFSVWDETAESYCTYTPTMVESNPWNNLLQKYAAKSPTNYQIADTFVNDLEKNGKVYEDEYKNEIILNALNDPSVAKPMLSHSHPMHNVFVQQELEIQNELHKYMRVYEKNKYLEGSLKSVSLDEYQRFESIYRYDDLQVQDQNSMKDILKTAASKGLDLIIPAANANWMKLLTVVGGVLLGIYMAQGVVLDFIAGSAGKRAIMWGVMSAIVVYGLTKTMEGLSATQDNIEKLDKILTNLSSLSDGEVIELGGPLGGGGGDSDLGTKPIFGPNNTEPVNLGIENNGVTPCVAGKNSDGSCKSVSTQLETAASVDGFNLGGGLAGSSTLVGAIGDGISGANNLSSGTLNNLNALGKKKSALANNRRAALDKLAKILKKNGKKPFEFNKRVSDFHDKMKATLKSSLAKQGLTPKLAAAKLGITGGGDDKKVAKEEGVQNREGVAAKGGAALKSTGKKIDFGFGSAGKTPNTAAMQFEDPNVIGKDEEYVLDDISDDKNANIFKIISVRYLKSGYNRLRSKKAQNILNN